MAHKKILQIIPDTFLENSEPLLISLNRNLASQANIHSCLLSLNRQVKNQKSLDFIKRNIKNLTVIVEPFPIPFLSLLRLKKLLKNIQPDIVHLWHFGNHPVLSSDRGGKYFSILPFLTSKHTDSAFKFIGQGLACCSAVPDTSDKIVDKATLLHSLQIPIPPSKSFPLLIGVIEPLIREKRIRELLWACDQLKFAQIDCHLIIIGEGPERDILFRYRDALLIRDHVHFLGYYPDYLKLLPCFDIVWSAGSDAGSSLPLLDAMAFGIPIIASDSPVHREFITSGKTGILIPDFDGDISRRRSAFSHETILLVRQETHRRQLGQNAQQSISRTFSFDIGIQKYKKLYEIL